MYIFSILAGHMDPSFNGRHMECIEYVTISDIDETNYFIRIDILSIGCEA